MNKLSAAAMACIGLGILSAPASAQEWILGTGYSDYSRTGAENGAHLSLEYQAPPFYESGRFSAGLSVLLSAQETGDAFVGAGLVAKLDFSDKWFVESSLVPGAYFDSTPANDLGSTFEIRSFLGVGYRIDPQNSISLGLAHKSNASTASLNPGVNTFLVRWHRAF